MNAVTTVANGGALVSFIERAAADEAFNLEKFEALLRLQREEQAKQAERDFFSAMATAQGEMEPVRKDSVNPHTKSRYASFEAIDSTVRPIYTRHGFSVSYRTGTSAPGTVRMICTVAHAGGHAIEAELTAGLDNSGAGGRTTKTDVQAVGSTVSYLRRYILSMIWNIALAGDDDDGEGSRAPARTWADDAPRRPVGRPTTAPRSRIDPVAAMNRAEMDRTLDGDDIPQLDKAALGVQTLEASIRAAANETELHAIAGSQQVEKQRAWLAKHRPELDTLLADALGARYAELVAARQEAEAEDPSLALDRPSEAAA